MQPQKATKTRTVKDWILATRPWSFPASSMPIIVTTAYIFWLSESGQTPVATIPWGNSLLALISIIMLHAAGNMWSDLNDYTSGVDTDTCYGVKTLLSGQFSTIEIKAYSICLLAMASIIGIILTYSAGIPVLVFGVSGLLLTLFYPFLKYHALGDLDIFLTYALLPIAGTSYILTGTIISQTIWLSLPLGLITVAILHVNNTRDVRTDKCAGIRTFAMIIGHRASIITYALEIILPFIIIAILAICHMMPYTAIAAFIALPIALSNTRATKATTPDNLKPIMALDEKTAQLQLAFSLLLSLTFVAGTIIA